MGPDGKVIYTGERETSGRYTFASHMDGVYTYCFSNQMSSMTPKTIMFNMEVGEAPKDHPDSDDSTLYDYCVCVCVHVCAHARVCRLAVCSIPY